ncbi:glycoside hydrolase family 88/105 protein [Autumnicola psychrophila]|uniref:Glycoside hydrolase family 88 protein n=1 Tax=Autumnicola psychrophila TaxID=3075592 RepID=A0ABU3DTK8_9FLAO|nr:glycoside hydrolase family 88 protein [Zunongwangia sp. F225]MDT0686983.1 glycoside hydrolase family 88 protein [Zunongwangia sp. F225]
MMKFQKNQIRFILICFALTTIISCKNAEKEEADEMASVDKIVPEDLNWSERMLQSEMYRFPEASKLDFREEPGWSYTNGLVLKAAKEVYQETNDERYYGYIYDYADTLITDEGDIRTYDLTDQNLDMLNSGNTLLFLYSKTKEERFLEALKLLRSQIETQPRTKKGGFWHKQRYTQQMWLDGLYMAHPFYAHYTQTFSEEVEAEQAYNDIVHQFDLVQEHMKDEETGLLYHGWDSSKQQKWADKKTGTSPNFWSRAMGWYGMAMVDVLDYLPQDHEGRDRIIEYLNQFAEAITKVQHKESGLWYQVLDQGDREGNYLEASGSSMFSYTLAKAAKKGYIAQKYMEVAEKAYEGVLNNLVTVEENGVVNLNQVCAVAGLGGDPYRDASYEYYINEEIRSNDPKGTGPFILASLQLDR